jgi:excisionase family DNA binding protein
MAIEKHYNGHELAELLDLDYETVLHKAQTGEIPSIRIGRLRKFPESGVKAYLARLLERENVIQLRPTVVSPIPKQEAK